MTDAVEVVAGDALEAYLESAPRRGQCVRISPPPKSWAALKPAVMRWARAHGRGPHPALRLAGYPLCAVGREFPMVPMARARSDGPVPEPCGGCSRRAECSVPAAWHDELQPFGPDSPLELWKLYHRRLSDALAMPYLPLADELVEILVRLREVDPSPLPFVLEPSVMVGREVKPSLRLVTFHGPLPRDDQAARARTRVLLALLAQMHLRCGWPAPTRLVAALSGAGAFPLPLGFEMGPEGQVRLKAYVRMGHQGARWRRNLVEQLLGELGVPAARNERFWERVEMLGLSLGRAGVEGAKLYVAADPEQGWPFDPLPPPGRLASPGDVRVDGALAVGRIRGSADAGNKWDFSTRDSLLSGPVVARRASEWFGDAAARTLGVLLDHREFHSDVVAIASYTDAWGLYIELS